MRTTEVIMPNKIFNFSGRSKINTWKLREAFEHAGWSDYSDWLVDEFPFMLQRIRDLADAFPFWQRTKLNGRPPYTERTLLIGFMLRQIFDTTFRRTIGLLKIFKNFFDLVEIACHMEDIHLNSSKNNNACAHL